jgi:hypothetical protein
VHIAIGCGRNSFFFSEHTAKVGEAGKASGHGNIGAFVVRIDQLFLGQGQSLIKNVLHNRDTQIFFKASAKIVLTYKNFLCYHINGQL